MIEQYVYNLIVADAALQALLTNGAGGYNVFPTAVPRELSANKMLTFTSISSFDRYPNIKSVNVQFNVFATVHLDAVAICTALANIFNEDNNHTSGGINVVFSIRQSESDLGYDFDEKQYQRQATYYFKIR